MTDSDKNEKPEGNLLPVQGARVSLFGVLVEKAALGGVADAVVGACEAQEKGAGFSELALAEIRRLRALIEAPPPAADDGQAVAQGWLAECEPYPEADFDMRNCAEQLAALLAEKIV